MKKNNNWELFEASACDFLNRTNQLSQVTFQKDGGKNSNSPDIRVFYKNHFLFAIEAKFSPAQSGQFALLEENDRYYFSPKNKFSLTPTTQLIINILNLNKAAFTPSGQKAIPILLEQTVLANWVIEHYLRKNSHFMITSKKPNDYKAIIPMKDILSYCKLSAVIRRKKSGSQNIPKSSFQQCIQELDQFASVKGLTIDQISSQHKKTLVTFQQDRSLQKSERYFGEHFYLSPHPNGEGYFLKKTSKTNNLNIIFQLDYIGPEQNIGSESLITFIQQQIQKLP